MKMDFYEVLNVPRDATVDEIKKAYKRMALQLHPDKNVDNREEAEEKFKKITEAYTILSDPEKRRTYDQFGTVPEGGSGFAPPGDIHEILKGMFGNMSFGESRGMGGGGPFEFMFGGGAGRERDLERICVSVTLEDVYQGAKKKVELEVMEQCGVCKGTGACDPSDIIKCIQCNGTGTMTQAIGPFFMAATVCPACFGNGTSVKTGRSCSKCKGEKMTRTKKSIEVRVPKGIPNNHTHVLKGHGNYNPQTKTVSDIILTFTYAIPTQNVRIDKDGNVFMLMDVSLEELLCGFMREIRLYGKPFCFRSDGYFDPGKRFIVPDIGLPSMSKNGRSGSLIVEFKVSFPDDAPKLSKYRDVFAKVFKVSDVEANTEENKNNNNDVINLRICT